MTFEQFTKLSEASPFHWEIFGEYNELLFEGHTEQYAMSQALEYGYKLEQEALEAERKLYEKTSN
jgi:hypothetical protein